MYEIVERYGVTGLKDLAKRKFSVVCGLLWDDAAFALAANCVHIDIVVKDEIAALMDEFSPAKVILVDRVKELSLL